MTFRRCLVAIFTLLALSVRSGGAFADEVDPATQQAVQSVISQQIEAFGREDAAAAQSFAVPELRAKFTDPSGFLTMVHTAYSALFNPRSTHFDETTETGEGPAQKVTIVAKGGEVWKAVYLFRQVEGQWRISGCVMAQEQGTPI